MPHNGFNLVALARQEMVERGFQPDFPADVSAQAAALAETPAPAAGGMRDLRGLLWSSIDNDSSRDLDQIEVAEQAGENIRIRVGIADVDADVPPDSPIDRYAADATTTVYAAVATFPMLPERLSTDLTSLNENADRAAIVIEMLVAADGSIPGSTVYPALVPNSHVLASVNHVFNAVFVRGDVVGDTLFYGRGAGKDATASAVLSDIADAALDYKHGTRNRIPPFVPHDRHGKVLSIDEVVSRYYLRLSVIDKPGTLAKITAILAGSKIGISSVIQPEGHEGESVPLILMCHSAPNAAMKKALAKIAKSPVIKAPPVMIRVESFD